MTAFGIRLRADIQKDLPRPSAPIAKAKRDEEMKTTVIEQDGADFYYRLEGFKRTQKSTAPFTVSDFDLVAATKARTWFIEREAPFLGIFPTFPA